MRRICWVAIVLSLIFVPEIRASLLGDVLFLRDRLDRLELSSQETDLLSIALDALEAYANILEPENGTQIQKDAGVERQNEAVRETAKLIDELLTSTALRLPDDKIIWWDQMDEVLRSDKTKGLEPFVSVLVNVDTDTDTCTLLEAFPGLLDPKEVDESGLNHM